MYYVIYSAGTSTNGVCKTQDLPGFPALSAAFGAIFVGCMISVLWAGSRILEKYKRFEIHTLGAKCQGQGWEVINVNERNSLNRLDQTIYNAIVQAFPFLKDWSGI